ATVGGVGDGNTCERGDDAAVSCRNTEAVTVVVLRRDRSRQTVAELRRVGEQIDAVAALVRAPVVRLVRIGLRVEVEERVGLARREAGELDKRRRSVEAVVAR